MYKTTPLGKSMNFYSNFDWTLSGSDTEVPFFLIPWTEDHSINAKISQRVEKEKKECRHGIESTIFCVKMKIICEIKFSQFDQKVIQASVIMVMEISGN